MPKTTTKPASKTSPANPYLRDEDRVTPKKSTTEIDRICAELYNLQRQRSIVIKSRIMQANRLQAIVAGEIGYTSAMAEGERKKKFSEADAVIKAIRDGGMKDFRYHKIVETTLIGIDAFLLEQEGLEKGMLKFAKQLPVAKSWIHMPDQTGFGLPSLGVIIGESGNLCNYANPGKLWRRFGCAPFQSEAGGSVKTLMGKTWRGGREGSLSKEEWEEFGYSPRRRSIMYVVGENLIKQNVHIENEVARWIGPYRQRYIDAKVNAFETHPEWDWSKKCERCDGWSARRKKSCPTCGGVGRKCGRAHNHGMLLASKLLLKNLWIAWNK